LSIKNIFLAVFTALLALLAGVLYITTSILHNNGRIKAAEVRRYESFRLADELRQSSDDLTRMARCYVVTGDPRFEEYFNLILAIRDGKAPRPDDYSGIYWDFVVAGGEQGGSDGEAVALATLMRRMEFTEQELAKLDEAKARSDALVAMEERAMNAVKGLFADADGNYAVRAAPDLELSRRLLHNEDYHDAKAEIMEPIDEFFDMVEARTRAHVEALRQRTVRLQNTALVLLVAAVVLIVVSYVLIRLRVVKRVKALAIAAMRVEAGDYAGRVTLGGRDELGLLGRTFNEMSAAIESDVAERQRAAQELARAREEAETANRAKSGFLANMSHELRTPMNAIIGYSEMLLEEMEEEADDAYAPDVKKVKAAGEHLLALINDILDLSKIEAGRMDLYLERFDLRQLIQDAVSTITPLVAKNRNELVTRLEDLGTVRADQTKVRQALFNLLSNAAKFTDEGTITLSARRERREEGDLIFLAVTDTGIGIAPEKISHVFEEFSQADESTTRDYGGTGLGLPISQRFCRLMGGDILVESDPGKGSTFTIQLPANVDALEAAKAAASDSAGDKELPPPGKDPVLVIDDDIDSRALLRRSLENDGHTVVTAASGAEGLDLAKQLQPSLITLDVMMPGMDGWEVLRTLKSDPETREIPVVMVTVEADTGLGYALGVEEYLIKPVDRKVLLELVRRFAGSRDMGRVLVVEDDEPTRKLLCRALQDAGWGVDEAANGKEGLDRVADQVPDLVLLDLMMPIVDGFEFMRRLRESDAGGAVPVIVLTAKHLTPDEKRFLEAHSRNIVSKGAYNQTELLDFVRRSAAARS